MKKFSPKLIRSLDTVPASKYDTLEKEFQEIELKLVKTLQSLIAVTIHFDKVCKLTNFTDLDLLTITEEEIINEINKLSKTTITLDENS